MVSALGHQPAEARALLLLVVLLLLACALGCAWHARRAGLSLRDWWRSLR